MNENEITESKENGEENSRRIPLSKMLAFSLGVLALMVAASVWVGSGLPQDARYPIHWGADGKPNGYGGLVWVLYDVPVTAAIVAGIFGVVPFIEPRKFSLQNSAKAYCALWGAMLILMLIVHFSILVAARGAHFNLNLVILPAFGGLFLVLGNYLGKIRSNFTFGIRTPWTLSSELSWNKTHRLAGRLFVVLGLISIGFSFFGKGVTGIILLIGGSVVFCLLLCVYSYFIWKSDPDKKTS